MYDGGSFLCGERGIDTTLTGSHLSWFSITFRRTIALSQTGGTMTYIEMMGRAAEISGANSTEEKGT